MASAPAPPGLDRALITKNDLQLARALLTRAREELESDQWAVLDRKLAEAERAWERFESISRFSGQKAAVPRAAPAAGLVAAFERIAPMVGEASAVPLLAVLGALWPSTVADGTLPAWSAAEIALASKLQDLAEAAKQVREEIDARRRRHPYVVRLQAQGGGVEESVVLEGPRPITVADYQRRNYGFEKSSFDKRSDSSAVELGSEALLPAGNPTSIQMATRLTCE